MPAKDNAAASRIRRIGQILKIFTGCEKVYSASLADKLQTDIRTIQRDLRLLRQAGIPVSEVSRGCYRLDKNLCTTFDSFDDRELALIVGIKDLVRQLGKPFQEAADGIFNRLYQSIGYEPGSPVFIKVDDPVALESPMLKKLLKAIDQRKHITFEYEVFSPYEVELAPYKIAFFGGFWYLIGKEAQSQGIRKYAIDKIENLKVLPSRFRVIPTGIDDMIKKAGNIWFSPENGIKVTVLVAGECADYFRRRNIHPSQKIEGKDKNGSLRVSFLVGSFDEIQHDLKKWLPHIVLVSPTELGAQMLGDMGDWMEWQKSQL